MRPDARQARPDADPASDQPEYRRKSPPLQAPGRTDAGLAAQHQPDVAGGRLDEHALGDEETMPPPSYEALAETCRRKVGRLIRRMARQLEASHSRGARRGVIQLAAVLCVVHTLRRMEQRTEWRSEHLTLVDPDHEWVLFEAGGLALAWGRSSMAPEALREGDGERFQELSLAIGLLAWLAWDVAIDVRSAVERTRPLDPTMDDDPWYPIQVFAAVAAQLAGDSDARETLGGAVARTKRRDADAGVWLATHLDLADRLVQVMEAPQAFSPAGRTPQSGDLVILGPALDPRVRVALDILPSGATHKVKVFDPEVEKGERQFLATHVSYVGWWERELEAQPIRA